MVATVMTTGKKGIGHYGKDPTGAVDGLGCRWYYNWTPSPAKTGIAAEFIPMIWSDRFATKRNLAAVKEAGYPALLGFNEPDGEGQADMKVSEAIELWPKLMETGLRLGSPGTCMAAPWLDEFMTVARQKNLTVDILCLHWYGDITKQGVNEEFHRYLEEYSETYHLPIWLTEYSGGDFDYHLRKTTVEDNARFARDTIKLMESLPYVERYAWFSTWSMPKDKHYSTVGLYEPDKKTLTPVGLAYRDTNGESRIAIDE